MTTEVISPTQDERAVFETGQVATIMSGHFVHDTYTAFVAPLLPLIIEKLSISLTLAGSLTAIMQLPAILNPLIGYLADRVSLRYFVILAPAVTATLISSLGFADSFFSVALLLFLTGVSVAAFHAPAPAMVARVSGRQVGKGMGLFMAGGELGRTLGPLVAVWGASLWGLEGIFRLMVAGWLTSALLFWRLRQISGRIQKPSGFGEVWLTVSPKLRSLYLPLSLFLLLGSFLRLGLSTFLPTYLKFEGSSLQMAGVSLAILQFAGVGGALFSGTLSDRLGRKPLLLAVTILSVPLTLAFLNSQDWLLIPLLLLLGFVSLSTGPVIMALVQDHFPQHRAVGNGLYMTISFLINSLVLVLLGVGGDAVGLRTTLAWSAWISLGAIPFIFLLPKTAENSA